MCGLLYRRQIELNIALTISLGRIQWNYGTLSIHASIQIFSPHRDREAAAAIALIISIDSLAVEPP